MAEKELLHIKFLVHGDMAVVAFSEPYTWISLPADQARLVAEQLISMADEIDAKSMDLASTVLLDFDQHGRPH